VTVRIQPKGGYFNKFVDVEIRVGNASSTGDFSQNQLLAAYKGPASVVDAEIHLETETPIVGKFVSLQSMVSKHMQICMLEVTL